MSPGPRPARAGPVTASGHAEWGDERTRAEGRDPGDHRRCADRRHPPAGRPRAGDRHGARLHAVVVAAVRLEGGQAAEPVGRRGHLRLPRARPVRWAVHHGRPGDQRPGRGGGLRAGAGLPPGRRGRFLDGRLGRGALRGPGRRPRRGGLGERARALVLPRHQADAPGPLGGRAPHWPPGHPHLAQDPGEPHRVGSRAGTPGRGGGADRADPLPGRPRGSGRLLPGGPRAPALRGGRGPQGAVGHPRVRPRRAGRGQGPDRPDRPLGPAGGEVPGRAGGRAGGR